MVSGHMLTVPTSFSSYLQSSATTLVSFSSSGSSSLSVPAGNLTSGASFPIHCPASISALSSSSSAVSLAPFSLAHSVFPHIPVSSTASLASFSVQTLKASQPGFHAKHQVAQKPFSLYQTFQGFFQLKFVCISFLTFIPSSTQSASIPVLQEQR